VVGLGHTRISTDDAQHLSLSSSGAACAELSVAFFVLEIGGGIIIYICSLEDGTSGEQVGDIEKIIVKNLFLLYIITLH
jgi:hypothetical protein